MSTEFFDRYASDLATTGEALLRQENPRLHEIYREMFGIQESYFDLDEDSEERPKLVARYDSLRDELINILGEDVGVGLIDPWMYDTFSDVYKSDIGFRPRGYTYRQAKDYMDCRQKGIA